MPPPTNPRSHKPNLSVRVGQLADAEPIAEVINAAFIVERVAFDGDRIDATGVGELMGKGRFLLAEEGANLVGCVYVEVQGERGYLGLLSVQAARQGAGLGRELAKAAEEHARSAGCHAMDLRIISPRAASLLPFYVRLGYAETGALPFSGAAPKVPCHYITMAKQLR